ncbi:MAG: hypothetical protein PHQ74_15250, partial [Crocinitomicaceae bacterium]|nr:hypothetical protein [Crocinitomicaceae bacterium]
MKPNIYSPKAFKLYEHHITKPSIREGSLIRSPKLSPRKSGYRNPRFDMIDSRIGFQNLWHTVLNNIEEAHFDLFENNNLDKAGELVEYFSIDEHAQNMSKWLNEIVPDVAAYNEAELKELDDPPS